MYFRVETMESPVLINWTNSGPLGKIGNVKSRSRFLLEGDRKVISSGLTVFYLKCLSFIQMKMSGEQLGYWLKFGERDLG